MRLSWNEIKVRSAGFVEEWKDARYEKADTQSFYNEFFEVFGVRRRRVASFEEPVKLLGKKRGYIDLFWKGVLLVEQKSSGRSLKPAKTQAFDYFPGLTEEGLPRYILLSDFQTFELYDLDEDTPPICFSLADLPDHVEAFGFIIGVQRRAFRDQDPVNIKASELMGKLHDSLRSSGYVGHDLERLLVRLLFCLFADDTGIFEPRDIFETLIRERLRQDGSDTGQWLTALFQVLNSPEEQRQKKLDDDLNQFPYVDGDLFLERLPIPYFDSEMRAHLIEACEFSWDAISPAIFGSLFQSVMSKKQRRAEGAHYTTEKNILKVIEPLFLDQMRSELDRLRARHDTGRTNALREFQQKLGRLTFFDPACGCGNFLIISYRELRLLEIDVLKALLDERGLRMTGESRVEQLLQTTTASSLSVVDVDQFYGIEFGEFPARIAEVAMWMMDHIMNNRLSIEFGRIFKRIPLKKSPNIRHADALEIDWADMLPPAKCSYVLGNPPFGGAKYQSDVQRAQVRSIARLGGAGGTLDYVTAWFLKAGAYMRNQTQVGFVATNSITQGEQVAQLWPLLFNRLGLEIAFAHRTFAWGSDARGMAHVHVVIIGLTKREHEPAMKRLFSYDKIRDDPIESQHKALSPYLFDASQIADRHLVVEERSRALCEVPRMITGTQPIDDGQYIFTEDERVEFLAKEPTASKFLRPYMSGDDFLAGEHRWILALQTATPAELQNMPHVKRRMQSVRAFRAASTRKGTRALADYPERFNVEVIPASPFLAIPEVSSERREYIPIAWLTPPVIPSGKIRFIPNADLWLFGILTSAMHMSWTRAIGGRLKSDYQYSVGINYNAFPWPHANDKQRAKVEQFSQAVLDARTKFGNATLAELYDADVMKPELRRAHRALDIAVDSLYRGSAFQNDRDRVEHLFGVYEKMLAPLRAAAAASSKPRRRSPA